MNLNNVFILSRCTILYEPNFRRGNRKNKPKERSLCGRGY